MHESLLRIQQLADQVEDTAKATLCGMNPTQLSWTPHKDRWSSAMIADHLIRSNGSFLPRLETAIASARKGKLDPTPANFAERISLSVYRPGTWIRLPVPPGMEPAPPADPLATVNAFLKMHDEFSAITRRLPSVEVDQVRIDFPIKPFRPRLVIVVESLLMHAAYHLRQVEALVEEPGFPR